MESKIYLGQDGVQDLSWTSIYSLLAFLIFTKSTTNIGHENFRQRLD
jgi:hypothetical protein